MKYAYLNKWLVVFMLSVCINPASAAAMGFADFQEDFYYNAYTSLTISNGYGCDDCISLWNADTGSHVSKPKSFWFQYALITGLTYKGSPTSSWKIVDTKAKQVLFEGEGNESAIETWKQQGWGELNLVPKKSVRNTFWLRIDDSTLIFFFIMFTLFWGPLSIVLSVITVYVWHKKAPAKLLHHFYRFTASLLGWIIISYIALYLLLSFG